MGELTSRILQIVKAAQSVDDFKDSIWIAGELFRHESSPEYHSGFKDIDSEEVSLEERDQLKDALLEALSRSAEPLFAGSLLSALSCTGDRDLLPLWVDSLQKHSDLLRTYNALVYMELLALRDLGELVFKEGKSLCGADMEINLKEAHAYLSRRKKAVSKKPKKSSLS
jgi:hypothetical protein